MSDFFQNGSVTCLHRLKQRPISEIETELHQFGKKQHMTLVLPSLFSELQGPALPNIVDHLQHATYIKQIIVGLDRANEAEYAHAKQFFAKLPQRTRIIWQDGPRMQALDQQLKDEHISPKQLGKGRNTWFCLGYALAQENTDVIALHDCDIITYERDLVARLFYPIANPEFDFKFAKGYYARVTDEKLNGRVTRLFLTPLLRALKQLLGNLDYLEYLDSFRYPLSGEFAMRSDIASGVRIPSDWGLEIGVLSEAYRNLARHQICQVDIADEYDHKHQDLGADKPNDGLSRMSTEIAKSIYRKLATEGVILSNEFFRTIKACYFRMALDMLRQYYCDARINGLSLDCHQEEKAIEVFTQSIITAGEQFLQNPMEVPFIPNWNRVFTALPHFSEELMGAVEADNRFAKAA